jgi:tripartite-type tricarboxylate transporter receptor subunit TctC
VPVSLVGRVPVVIAANPSAPYSDIKALVAAAKAKPGTIPYATPGNGSTPQMAVELFAHAAGIQLQHVPYKGGAPAITDVIGGQVPLVAVNALEVQPHVKTGKLKVIAVLSDKRTAIFPDVATIAESGWPGFEASVWYGLVAPAKTPKPIVDKLHDAVQKALAAPEVKQRMTAVGGEVIPGSEQMFGQLIHDDVARYANIVKVAHIKPN